MTLLLIVPFLTLAVLIRLGTFSGATGFLDRQECDPPLNAEQILATLKRDIVQLEKRLEAQHRNGDSGTWTARFAASWRRRRLAELRGHRLRLLAEMVRLGRSWTNSTAVCLDRSPVGIKTRRVVFAYPNAIQVLDDEI
jgi:hypothetical protein